MDLFQGGTIEIRHLSASLFNIFQGELLHYTIPDLEITSGLGMVANACNGGIKEAEVGKLYVQGKPRLQSKPLIQKLKRRKVTVTITIIWRDFLAETM